jgi:hypothetical protein
MAARRDRRARCGNGALTRTLCDRWHERCSSVLVAMSGVLSDRLENTVDATRGLPLADRVLARKNELEDALADLGPYDSVERDAIEEALHALYFLMPGDIAHPSPHVGRALSEWLERNKYVGLDIIRRQQAERLARMQQHAQNDEQPAKCANHSCEEAA